MFNLEGATVLSKYGNTLDEKPTLINGDVAQLGEHLPCTQGVRGSIPLISTITLRGKQRGRKVNRVTTSMRKTDMGS